MTKTTHHPSKVTFFSRFISGWPGLFCNRLVGLTLGFSLVGLLLASCGTVTEVNQTGVGAIAPTSKASQVTTSNLTPQYIAGELVNILKSAQSGSAGTGGKFTSSQVVAANFPPEAKQVVQGKGNSYGSLFATDQYGLLLSSTPWKILDVAGVDGTKYTVLESEFQYQLTNGVARLGFSKTPTDWVLATYQLDFDPLGVLSRSGKTDGLEKIQPKGFLEAVNSLTRERLDTGIESVYGVDTGFIAVDNTHDRWKSRTKPFSISLNPALEGRSAQWLLHFDGRDKQRQSILGTIRMLDGQPWGLFLDTSTGTPQKPELGFRLSTMKVDSVAACAKISYKPQCAKLGYDKDGWGVVLGD